MQGKRLETRTWRALPRWGVKLAQWGADTRGWIFLASWVIHSAFYALLGFRETPNLEADMYLECTGGKCLKLGRSEENCVINPGTVSATPKSHTRRYGNSMWWKVWPRILSVYYTLPVVTFFCARSCYACIALIYVTTQSEFSFTSFIRTAQHS